MNHRITVTLDDETAALVANTNASATVRDALRWVRRLGLTDERADALANLFSRLRELGVEDPLGHIERVAEAAYRDGLGRLLQPEEK